MGSQGLSARSSRESLLPEEGADRYQDEPEKARMFVYEDDAEDDSTFATPTWALKIWPRLFHNRAIFIVACSLLGAVVFLAATALLISRHTAGNIHLRNAITFSNGTTFDKHRDMRFVGLVFFGRRQFADILDCHLRRNLAVNGGLLDEVRWVMHTKNETDRQWLQNLVREQGLQEQYTLQFEDTSKEGWTRFGAGFRWIWSTMTDENTIYIKIDDDMVWIDDQAIPELLRLTLEHPEAHSVMSNIVNNAFNHLHHYRTGAVWPYLADQNSPLINGSVSWRPSKLPDFTGDFPNSTISNGWLHQYEPPSEGHRWLPLRGANPVKAMLHTPYSNELPDPRQIDFVHGGWPLAAQSHYSLFENLERKNLDAYDFGNKDGFQNLWFGHYSINMMAIRGSYVALKPFWDEEAFPPAAEHGDEGLLTEIVPKLLGMPVLLATRSLAAHYAYRADRQAVLKTDVLGRYRSYANEMVCSARNQKFAFDTLPP